MTPQFQVEEKGVLLKIENSYRATPHFFRGLTPLAFRFLLCAHKVQAAPRCTLSRCAATA